MGYIKRKARNDGGFHSKRHAKRAAMGEVQKVLTKVASFGLTLVTIKRRADAYRMIAREHFPAGTEDFRERREGVLSSQALVYDPTKGVPATERGQRVSKRVMKLRANYAGRMAEVG
jgi:hypothetical protein